MGLGLEPGLPGPTLALWLACLASPCGWPGVSLHLFDPVFPHLENGALSWCVAVAKPGRPGLESKLCLG